MTVSEVHDVLSNRYNDIMSKCKSVVFLRKSDNTFLGTDIAVSAVLDNPDLYYADDDPKLFEIVKGLFLGKYTIIQDATNSVVSIG